MPQASIRSPQRRKAALRRIQSFPCANKVKRVYRCPMCGACHLTKQKKL